MFLATATVMLVVDRKLFRCDTIALINYFMGNIGIA
jgi:hypothetical protein